jgi:hypothetical protein
LDRWVWETVNGAAVSIQQVTSVLNSSFVNALQLSVTTADTSIGTTEYAMIGQKIEGYNVLHLTSKTFTLSFWVASPKTGTHCVAFRNSGANRSYIATYTVNVANTLEYKTITVTNGLIVDGTWNWADGVGLNVSFVLACGSALHTTAGAWQTGNFLATSAQVNCLDNTANVFYLTCVQLEEGPVATPIERRSYGAELALCQRYYWRGQPASAYNYPAYAASSVGSWFTPFPVTMRATPTLNYNFTGATLSYCSVLSYGAATTQGARMNLLSSAATTNAYVSLTASNYFEATIEL